MTSNVNQYWRSNIMSGYSVDNISPAAPLNLSASVTGNSIDLNWSQNTETDLHHYIIYRNNSLLNTSYNNYFNDETVMNDSLYNYQVAAADIHGNISPLSEQVYASLNNSGQLNLSFIIEGFYDPSLNNMRRSDTAIVCLRNSSSPYLIIDSSKGVINGNTLNGIF